MEFVLCAYLLKAKRDARIARELLNRRIENVRQVVAPIYEDFAEIMDRIVQTKNRIRVLTRGAATSDTMAAPQRKDAFETMSEADLYVLKRAYREAARLAHPDGGGSVEDFQSVYNAYLAKDLYALNSYVLSRQKPSIDLIRHWLTDAERCRVAWVEFQASGEFTVASLIMRGQPEEAHRIVHEALIAQLSELRAEECRLILREVPRPQL
jgi:hypothetical protein